MDSKITKQRINNYFSYEWIVIVVFIVASCLLWEIFYGIASVKPTIGQEFKYYYDASIDVTNARSFHNFMYEKGAFSFDILENNYEEISEDYQVLNVRLEAGEGDIMITQAKNYEEQGLVGIRAKELVDKSPVYSLDQLALDGREYLKTLLKDGALAGAEIDYQAFDDNFDLAKIKQGFEKRLGRDNRFRNEEQKQEGLKLEIERIKKLSKDLSDFCYFLDNAPEQCFYRYTKYEQTYNTYKDQDEHWDYYKDLYRPLYETEVKERPNARYAISVECLKGGAIDPARYFKIGGETTAKDVVIMAFNFKTLQPELQFECVSFMATIVRECSNFCAR
jgi:hypothetical protein